MTFQDIGIRFGISGERIRQIYNKIKQRENFEKQVSQLNKLAKDKPEIGSDYYDLMFDE